MKIMSLWKIYNSTSIGIVFFKLVTKFLKWVLHISIIEKLWLTTFLHDLSYSHDPIDSSHYQMDHINDAIDHYNYPHVVPTNIT